MIPAGKRSIEPTEEATFISRAAARESMRHTLIVKKVGALSGQLMTANSFS